MVTAGGAGLDPHIPPAAAEIQAARIARARNVDPQRVRNLMAAYTDAPALGVFGRERINVLELNLALDEAFGQAPN
jgi:K+-transporting ATPase ATPase C chain